MYNGRSHSECSHAYGSVPSLENGDGDAPPRGAASSPSGLGQRLHLRVRAAREQGFVKLAFSTATAGGALKKAALTMTACQLFGVALICGKIIHLLAVIASDPK